MKTAALFFLVLLLLVAPAFSQTLDDKLIVPGTRIGKWTLKMTLDDLEKMNGPATVSHLQFADFRREAFFYVWYSLDFAVSAYEPRKLAWFVCGFTGGVPWRTEKGITLQKSTRADLLRAYGKPSVETVPLPGQRNMIYDAIGIGFQVFRDGTIREIRIFRPGTARKIWKF